MANGLRKVETVADFPSATDIDSVWYAKLDAIVGYFKRLCLLLTYRNGEKRKEFGVSGVTSDMIVNSTELVSAKIPDTVVVIGDNAFSDCQNLTCVGMSPNITHIGYYAFYNCSSLTSLKMCDSVQSYEHNSFNGCSGITELYMGSGITYDNNIFQNITNVERLTCKADIVIGDDNVSLTLLKGKLQTVTIGGKTELASNAFADCPVLKKVKLLDGIYSISNGAFASCPSLTEVKLPKTLTYINENAFSDCGKLAYVDFNQVEYIDYNAFQNCTSLDYIVIPSTVTDVDTYAFANCSGLTKVLYNGKRLRPNMVRQFQATGLKLTIGDNVVNFNGSNFSGATCLSEVDYMSSFMPTYMFYNCVNLEKVVFNGSLTYIPQNAFGKCTSLSSITIPNGIIEIASNAFSDCTNLSVINYDGPATGYPWGAPLLT